MLDIKYIRENPEQVKKGAAAKNVEVDVDRLLAVDSERRQLIKQIEDLKAKQNRESEAVAKEKDKAARQDKIEALKSLKEEIRNLEPKREELGSEFDRLMRLIPNLPADDVKPGKDDSENYTIREVGERPQFGFQPKDYMALGEALGIIDVERAGKTSGSRFGFIKGEGALLQFALVQYVLNELTAESFQPVVPPVLVNQRAMSAMGYLDRGADEVYHLEKDDLYLIGTSEQVLGAMHMDEVLLETELPLRYVGYSSCFRREAGSYGKDVRGILRVHQFDKLEMFSFVLPEHSGAEHEKLLELEERLVQGLGIPYRVVGIVSGDLGDPAAKKYDIEAWVPSQDTYRETHSTSNCTDWQARRLNVRVKRKNGELQFCHTLNGTAFAIGRAMLAILENFQEADGTVRIPAPLVPYMGGRTHISRQ